MRKALDLRFFFFRIARARSRCSRARIVSHLPAMDLDCVVLHSELARAAGKRAQEGNHPPVDFLFLFERGSNAGSLPLLQLT